MSLTPDAAFNRLTAAKTGVGQAYLLYGADTDSLFALALRFASHLLRTNAPTRHPDFFAVAPSGRSRTIPTESILTLERILSHTSYAGGAKVAIIHEAERMNISSANKLLKTLEEPSAETYFFLTSPSADAVLPTILSRCIPVPILVAPVMAASNLQLAVLGAFRGATAPDKPLVSAAFQLAARITEHVDSCVADDISHEKSDIAALKASAEKGEQISQEIIANKEDILDGMLAAKNKYYSEIACLAVRSFLTRIFAVTSHDLRPNKYWPSAIGVLTEAMEGIERGGNRRSILESVGLALLQDMPADIRHRIHATPAAP